MQFTPNPDPRIADLEELAREEGIVLPMPADMIVFLPRQFLTDAQIEAEADDYEGDIEDREFWAHGC